MNTCRSMWALVVVCLLSSVAAAWEAPLRIQAPSQVSPEVWPILTGVPLPQGLCSDAAQLTVTDERGQAIACQITPRARWRDGSLRWVHVAFNAKSAGGYRLTTGTPAAAKDDLRIEQNGESIVVRSGEATYTFHRGDGSFRTMTLAKRTLVDAGQDAFFVVDSQGRRGVFKGQSLKLEESGPRHAVVRVQGEYLTAEGQRNAAGVVYFHFFAGLPWCRVSHKLIVSEETLDLWFRDIGMTLPLAIDARQAHFNHQHGQPSQHREVKLGGNAPVVMVQSTYPHFAKQESQFTLRQGEQVIEQGAACGDWAAVGDSDGGIAMQNPAFAEQFPKAFVASTHALTLKFWAGEEAGQELDYRTEKIIPNYLGSDWVPPDHAVMKVPNTARGSAKTHDVWLYPYAGSFAKQPAHFAATAQPIYAVVDPQWVCDSGAFGPIHPYDPQRFADIEHVIDDYFKRGVLVGQKIFPSTGYLYWGMYPFSCQPWELRNGRWYPTLHRVSRSLEYNLKRMMWVLFARSGQRQYHDYARKYTRLCHDLLFSNWDAGSKPKGWIMQGTFDSPLVWGAWGESAIRAGKKPSMFNNSTAAIAVASSEDVIQFVYDWFMSGEHHSRDMALNWKQAMIDELQWDDEKATNAFYPSVVFLRILGSVYELDQDPQVLEFGHKILSRTVDAKATMGLNPQVKQNYGKAGDVFSVFFYYWVSTGDELALVPLRELAKFDYENARMGFMSRSSAAAYAYGMVLREQAHQGMAGALATYLRQLPSNEITLERLGANYDSIDQNFAGEWGQMTLTGAGPIFYGLPVAMKAVADHNPPPHAVPRASKSKPTARTTLIVRRDDNRPAVVDVHVNIVGDGDDTRPRLLDTSGRALPMQITERFRHRITKPPGTPGFEPSYDPFYFMYETHVFYTLAIGADVGPGVYELDFGNEVTWTVQWCDLPAVMQAAPQGTVLVAGQRHWFNVPADVDHVDLFVHRPIEVLDPDGKAVALEALKEPGMHRFATGRHGGAWSIRTIPDKFLTPGQPGADSFVRFANIPMLLSTEGPQSLFAVDAKLGTAEPLQLVTAPQGEPFVPGKFGQGALLFTQHLELPLQSSPPLEQGTIEFWFYPQWSATDFDMAQSTQRLSLLRMGPVTLDWNSDNPNSGRTAYYNEAKLVFALLGADHTRADVYFQAGRWYHIAVTWNLDGQNSQMDIFVNGRKRCYAHYNAGLPRSTAASVLKPGTAALRFGSGHTYGRGAMAEIFDDLRISRVVRYHEDFEAPTKAHTPDDQTWLLLPLDGNRRTWCAGQEIEAVLKSGGKLD